MSNQYVNYKCDTFGFVYVFPSIDFGPNLPLFRSSSLSLSLYFDLCITDSSRFGWVFQSIGQTVMYVVAIQRVISRHSQKLTIKTVFWCHALHYILPFVVRSLARLLFRLFACFLVRSNCDGRARTHKGRHRVYEAHTRARVGTLTFHGIYLLINA